MVADDFDLLCGCAFFLSNLEISQCETKTYQRKAWTVLPATHQMGEEQLDEAL